MKRQEVDMPDFERVLDQMRVELAQSPEERARAEGFIEGKRYARKEIALMVGVLVGIVVLLAAWV